MPLGLVQNVRAASAAQLVRDLRNLPVLVTRAEQLVRRWHARAIIATGNRRRTVRRPAGNLVESHLTGMAVVETDNVCVIDCRN